MNWTTRRWFSQRISKLTPFSNKGRGRTDDSGHSVRRLRKLYFKINQKDRWMIPFTDSWLIVSNGIISCTDCEFVRPPGDGHFRSGGSRRSNDNQKLWIETKGNISYQECMTHCWKKRVDRRDLMITCHTQSWKPNIFVTFVWTKSLHKGIPLGSIKKLKLCIPNSRWRINGMFYWQNL
jgi:hypothetical protein